MTRPLGPGKTVRVIFCIEEEVWERFKTLAQKHNANISKLLRLLVEQELKLSKQSGGVMR
jgi:hypothetical protein